MSLFSIFRTQPSRQDMLDRINELEIEVSQLECRIGRMRELLAAKDRDIAALRAKLSRFDRKHGQRGRFVSAQ